MQIEPGEWLDLPDRNGYWWMSGMDEPVDVSIDIYDGVPYITLFFTRSEEGTPLEECNCPDAKWLHLDFTDSH